MTLVNKNTSDIVKLTSDAAANVEAAQNALTEAEATLSDAITSGDVKAIAAAATYTDQVMTELKTAQDNLVVA